jgi:hypothetical protein
MTARSPARASACAWLVHVSLLDQRTAWKSEARAA